MVQAEGGICSYLQMTMVPMLNGPLVITGHTLAAQPSMVLPFHTNCVKWPAWCNTQDP